MNHHNPGTLGPRVSAYAVIGISAAVVLFTFGCATAPPVEEAPEPVTSAVPTTQPEAEPEPVFRTVYLPTRERVYRADGTLDSYREFHYEDDGLGLTKELRYSGTGELVQTRVYQLQDGRPVKEHHYDSEERLQSMRRYQHDAEGNLIEEEVFDAADELLSRSSYTYDEQGRRTSWRVFTGFAGFMGTTVYRFDNGNLVRIESLNPRDELEEYFVNEFDARGRPTRRTHYGAADRRLAHIDYEYEGNHLQVETHYRSSGAVQRSVQYEYDGAGNVVIEYHRDGSGNLRERIEREFTSREIQE